MDPFWHPLSRSHVGIWGDILCAEKTAEHAAEGAPVSSSFTLQQRHVFRDKNEAGMQGDAWAVLFYDELMDVFINYLNDFILW